MFIAGIGVILSRHDKSLQMPSGVWRCMLYSYGMMHVIFSNVLILLTVTLVIAEHITSAPYQTPDSKVSRDMHIFIDGSTHKVLCGSIN